MDMPHNGILPLLDNEAARCPYAPGAMEEFSNYRGVEEEGLAEQGIAKHLSKGFLKAFSTSGDLRLSLVDNLFTTTLA